MTFNLIVFGLGLFGGFAAEVYRWYQIRESNSLPEYARSPLYWIVSALMILIGGGLAWLWQIDPAQPFLAVQVGVSAPLIIKAVMSVIPPVPIQKQIERAASDHKASLKRFLA